MNLRKFCVNLVFVICDEFVTEFFLKKFFLLYCWSQSLLSYAMETCVTSMVIHCHLTWSLIYPGAPRYQFLMNQIAMIQLLVHAQMMFCCTVVTMGYVREHSFTTQEKDAKFSSDPFRTTWPENQKCWSSVASSSATVSIASSTCYICPNV